VGLPKDHVGRIEIKEAFSVVDIRMEDAARAITGLNQLSARGRPWAARAV
jgi:hypothetical protein